MTALVLKFGVPAEAQRALRKRLLALGASRLHLRSHCFDTADGTLARQRIVLRLCQQGPLWVQSLTVAGQAGSLRLQHEVPVSGKRGVTPALDLSLHRHHPAGPALYQAMQAAAQQSLVVSHATDIWRLRATLHGPHACQVEAALDIGSVSAGDRSASIAGFELAYLAGPVEGLFEMARDWLLPHGLWLSTTERGLQLAAGNDTPVVFKMQAPRLAAGADGPTLLRALLLSALDQVLGNSSAVAEGCAAPETIHQLRVGLRRLRVVLRELASLSPCIAPGWDAALASAFGPLGTLRDQVAVAEAVRPLLQAAHAPRWIWQAGATQNPGTTVRAPTYQLALLGILGLAHAGPQSFAPLSARAARNKVVKRLNVLHHRVTAEGRGFEQLPLRAQHRVRKRLKRLRYLADFMATPWFCAQTEPYLQALRDAQEALGLHNDVGVAAEAFRLDAGLHPESWFAAGYLKAHLGVTARAGRRALSRLAKTPVFWPR